MLIIQGELYPYTTEEGKDSGFFIISGELYYYCLFVPVVVIGIGAFYQQLSPLGFNVYGAE